MYARSRLRSLLAAAVLTGLAVTVLGSCERTPNGTYLSAPGGDTFVSAFEAIQVVGDFNSFNDQVQSMNEREPGIWADTLTVQEGCYLMKLRTDNDWDETPDFGRCSGTEGDCQTPVPDDGTETMTDVCEVTGEGTAIGQLDFGTTGSYEFVFDEIESILSISRSVAGSIAGTVAFAGLQGEDLPEATVTVLATGTEESITSATSSTLTGNYLVEGLPPGRYDLSILADGYREGRVENVAVIAFETTQVDTVTLQEGCSSAFSATGIQIVGDFNGWDTGVPSMIEVEPCVWVDTLLVNPGSLADTCTYVKFRTGGDWTPDDYANCGSEDATCTTPLSGSICQGSDSDPPALGRLPLALGGSYEFRIDEGSMTYEIRRLDIAGGTVEGTLSFSDGPSPLPEVTVNLYDAGTTDLAASGRSSPADGSFSVFVAVGTYDVEFEAPGYDAARRDGIDVALDAVVDLGTVELQASAPGTISGVVAFDDGPAPPLPVATIEAHSLTGDSLVASTTSDSQDGSFLFGSLRADDYRLAVTAEFYADAAVDSIRVPGGADADAGTITLERLRIGSIEGTVTLSNSPTSPPTIDIRVREAGTPTVVAVGAADPADGSFRIDDILEGSYDVLFTATGYHDQLVMSVAVVDQQVTDLGTVQLLAECSSALQVVGDFNGWDEGAPLMTSAGDCLWSVTITVPAGCHRLKFRTDGDWDQSPDWGRCAGLPGDCETLLATNQSVWIDRICTGVGLADALGEFDFREAGTYQFQVNEEDGTFAIFGLGPGPEAR